MFRMYHIPRRGKRKGQELPTNYWHKTVESAEAHSRWWTREVVLQGRSTPR